MIENVVFVYFSVRYRAESKALKNVVSSPKTLTTHHPMAKRVTSKALFLYADMFVKMRFFCLYSAG